MLETNDVFKSRRPVTERYGDSDYLKYEMNKYRKQLNSNHNDHSTKWTPQYILHLFDVTDYALKEAFLNIVQSFNPIKTVISDNREDVDVYLDEDIYIDREWIDVYDVINGFNITDAATQHAVKKILMCGARGHKDKEQDLMEIISALSRMRLV